MVDQVFMAVAIDEATINKCTITNMNNITGSNASNLSIIPDTGYITY